MSKLTEMKAAILEDGVIDEGEVREIKAVIYEDGTIDQEEADFLFELNDGVSGNDNHSSWNKLFITAISEFLLEDDDSPGEIDAVEAEWLYQKIAGDGQLDELEKDLLMNLKRKAKLFPSVLNALL